MPPLSKHFRRRYLESLEYYRFYYDDLAVYGSPDAPRAFYFVPGFNGVPGQVRFVLPSLLRNYGAGIYVKGLSLPEFAARRPIWDKYTTANLDLRRRAIIADLDGLLSRFPRVTVLCSSSGFYDFAGAMNDWDERRAEQRLRVIWAPCADDRNHPTVWEDIFFAFNGVVENGFRWFAYPNHWLVHLFNEETKLYHRWRFERQKRRFYKSEVESRFVALGMTWDYLSISCFGAMTKHMVSCIRRPLDLPARVLVATKDGYFKGRTREDIEGVIGTYLTHYDALYKPASHLWVMTPENFSETLPAPGDDAVEDLEGVEQLLPRIQPGAEKGS